MAIGKQKILDEIVRTATANGGKALGRLRFETETGISQPDWQRHWIRWNDAVKEAGFQPNEPTQAYDEMELLRKLRDFIRELGHFPVVAEFRMKARLSGFPSEKTFWRLGTRPELAAKIRELCITVGGFEDVVEICATIATSPDRDAAETDKLDDQEDGCVYLLKLGKQFKIGRAKDFNRRERQLAIQMPERAETVHVIRTDDPVGIERYWHMRFAAVRLNGEWFQLKPADVKAFKRRKSFM